MLTTLSRAIIICISLLLPGYSFAELNSEQLKSDLEKLFTSEQAKDIFWGISVMREKDGAELFSLNKEKRFRPASNMKVVIAASALKALNSEYRFHTKLFADGKIHKGVLEGNLVVVGSGDPTFKASEVSAWTKKLRALRIKEVRGDIIGIDTIFDDQKTGLMWSWDDLSNCYSAQISGLQINSNCAEIIIRPGTDGEQARVQTIPHTSYINIVNQTTTGMSPSSLEFKREEGTNRIYIRGIINRNSGAISKWISVNNPTLYFVNLFYEDLQRNGIQVQGDPVDARDTGYILKRSSAYQIAEKRSPMIKSIINDFLKYSINLYGESILKSLGFIYFNNGSTYNGRLAVNLILKQYKLPDDVLFIADGSGLSMLNMISPEYMSKLLYAISKGYFYRTFFDALSTSGMDGTLRKRLNTPELKGKVHAKTGYIRNVRALSGYIDTVGNERLVFSIFANNYNNRLDNAEYVIDRACNILHSYGGDK